MRSICIKITVNALFSQLQYHILVIGDLLVEFGLISMNTIIVVNVQCIIGDLGVGSNKSRGDIIIITISMVNLLGCIGDVFVLIHNDNHR